MANGVKGAGILHQRRSSKGWRSGRGARKRLVAVSDGTSDEDFVVAGEEEGEEDDRSYCSYVSDTPCEGSDLDARSSECCEEEEEEEDYDYGASECEQRKAAVVRRPRKRLAPARSRRERKAKSSGRRKTVGFRVFREVKAHVDHRSRKVRSGSQSAIIISDESSEGEYDDGIELSLKKYDEEEYTASSPVPTAGGLKHKPLKRQKRRSGADSDLKGKVNKKKAPVRKKRWRISRSSDDDDFVVNGYILAGGVNQRTKKTSCERKRRAERLKIASISDGGSSVLEDGVSLERTQGRKRKKRATSNGRKKRTQLWHSDTSDSDFDYTAFEEEVIDMQARSILTRRQKECLSSTNPDRQKERVNRADETGKQICGICLSNEQYGATQGMLDCCSHYFCFMCIIEWSKVESRCPMCKQRFKTIVQLTRSGSALGLPALVKRIPKRDQVYEPSEEELRSYLNPYADVVCIECQQGDDDHLMLLCDICDSPAHTYCVGLGMVVPEGNWYCDGCRSMDSGSFDPHVLQSMIEHETSNIVSLYASGVETCSADPTNDRAHETPQGPAPLRSHTTPSPVSGFVASTLSARRSIRRRMQTIMSNSGSLTPEGNGGHQRLSTESCTNCNLDSHPPGKILLHAEEGNPESGTNGSSSGRLFSSGRLLGTHIEATGFGTEEASKAWVETPAKK